MIIIVPDPGVLLNLVAGECSSKIGKSLDARFVVPEQSLCEELPFEQHGNPQATIESHLARAQIEVERLNGNQELDYYIEFLSMVNEGESASVALAAARGWILATDDTLLRDLFCRVSPAGTLTTAALFKRWEPHVSRNELGTAVRVLHEKAGFFCPPEDPDIAWWRSSHKSVFVPGN